MKIERPQDDRLERMMADPEAYFAEAEERARELVEREIAREIERDRQQRRERRRERRKTFWKFGPRGWKS